MITEYKYMITLSEGQFDNFPFGTALTTFKLEAKCSQKITNSGYSRRQRDFDILHKLVAVNQNGVLAFNYKVVRS